MSQTETHPPPELVAKGLELCAEPRTRAELADIMRLRAADDGVSVSEIAAAPADVIARWLAAQAATFADDAEADIVRSLTAADLVQSERRVVAHLRSRAETALGQPVRMFRNAERRIENLAPTLQTPRAPGRVDAPRASDRAPRRQTRQTRAQATRAGPNDESSARPAPRDVTPRKVAP